MPGWQMHFELGGDNFRDKQQPISMRDKTSLRVEIAARNEFILMKITKTFIARVKSALQKSLIITSCNF